MSVRSCVRVFVYLHVHLKTKLASMAVYVEVRLYVYVFEYSSVCMSAVVEGGSMVVALGSKYYMYAYPPYIKN